MNKEEIEDFCEDILSDIKSIVREKNVDISMNQDLYQKEINRNIKVVIEELNSYLINL